MAKNGRPSVTAIIEKRRIHYEETKHMTSEEYARSVHEEVKEVMEKYNIKFKIEEPKH